MQKVLFAYFVFINVVAFVIYWLDKLFAKSSKERISEKELHAFSLLGGFLGASLSMFLFKHKVSKSSFLLKHIVIILLWIGAIVLYFTAFDEINFLR